MKDVAILGSAPVEIRDVFDYVFSKNLDENSKAKDIKSEAVQFVKGIVTGENGAERRLQLRQHVTDFSFYDVNNFTADTEKNEALFKKMVILSRFKEELINILSDNKKKTVKFGKLERKISPPLKAYVYTGNNKLDIAPSKRSYGLLFE